MVRSVRRMVVAAVAVAGLMAGATAATGSGASISPSLQGGTSPYYATWNLSWSGNAPYEVTFLYGDGGFRNLDGWGTSATAHRAFGGCYNKNFYQDLLVWDALDQFASATSRVNVQAGICR